MGILRTIVYVSAALTLPGLGLPQSRTADVLWWTGLTCLVVSISVWIYKSNKYDDRVPQPRGIYRSDLNLPWLEILRKMARLRLHYVDFVNVALCAFALTLERPAWLVLLAALLSAAFLFLIGQAIVLKRSFTNFGAIDREAAPRRFRVNLTILIVLYVATSALPFVSSSLLPREQPMTDSRPGVLTEGNQ
jgi:hypothetical protein